MELIKHGWFESNRTRTLILHLKNRDKSYNLFLFFYFRKHGHTFITLSFMIRYTFISLYTNSLSIIRDVANANKLIF